MHAESLGHTKSGQWRWANVEHEVNGKAICECDAKDFDILHAFLVRLMYQVC